MIPDGTQSLKRIVTMRKFGEKRDREDHRIRIRGTKCILPGASRKHLPRAQNAQRPGTPDLFETPAGKADQYPSDWRAWLRASVIGWNGP